MTDKTYKIEFERQWTEKFPVTLIGLLAFYQCLCTIAIIGCEIGSVMIDVFNATIYVGFWASMIFMVTWIVQAVTAGWRRNYQFATYTFVMQCITLVFALCVICFDSYFISNSTACFFSTALCNIQASGRGLFYSSDNFNSVKIPLIKGQLAVGVLMFAFSIDYIIIYVVFRVHIKNTIEEASRPVRTTRIIGRRSTTVGVLNMSKNTKNSPAFPSSSRHTIAGIDIFSESSMVKSLNRSRWSIDSINDI